jgi:hypothetical protein
MKMDANRVLILDLEFRAELLTAGVYWNIFDGLPPAQRETFRDYGAGCSNSTPWIC